MLPKLENAQGALPPVDRTSAVVAASYIVALNAMILNIQPMLLGALSKEFGFTDRILGEISAVYIGAITLLSLSGPLWVRRSNWRMVVFVTTGLIVVGLAWGLTLKTYTGFLALFVILGVLKGIMGVPPFASLGDSRNPDRAYAISAIAQGVVSATVAAMLASYIVPDYGVRGILLTLAAFYGSGLLCSHLLPRKGRIRFEGFGDIPAPTASKAMLVAPLVATLGVVLFMGGVLLFWYFVEQIGVSRGVDRPTIGLIISVTALSSTAASGINAWLAGRYSSLSFIAVGTVVMLLGYAMLAYPGAATFAAANLLFALGWGFSTPAYWANLRIVDATGRVFVAAPAASGVAGVLAGLAAGPIIEETGYNGLLWSSGTLLALGVVVAGLAVVAFRRASELNCGLQHIKPIANTDQPWGK